MNVTSIVTQLMMEGSSHGAKEQHVKSSCFGLIGISFCHNKALVTLYQANRNQLNDGYSYSYSTEEDVKNKSKDNESIF